MIRLQEYTVEEPGNNDGRELLTINGELQAANNHSAVVLSTFGLEGNICSVYFSTGEVLLDVPQVIISLSLASFTDC